MPEPPPNAPNPPAPEGPARPGLAWATRTLVGLALLAAGAGIFLALKHTKPQVAVVDPEAVVREVPVVAARFEAVRRQWRGSGTVEAVDSADVPARVTATVLSIPEGVRAGRRVVKGQPLVQLDPEDFNRQVEIAQQRIAEIEATLAQLDVEQARLKEQLVLEEREVSMGQTDMARQKRLTQRGAANVVDVDNAERMLLSAERSLLATRRALDLIAPRRRGLDAQAASQRAQINLAELGRQRTAITSPIAGVLQSVDVEPGEGVTAGQRVARVVGLDRVEVPIRLPAAAAADVAVSSRVVLKAPGGPAATLAPGWVAQITRISPEQDPATHTVTAFAELSNTGASTPGGAPCPLPAPGMYLAATVDAAADTPGWIVPQRALQTGRLQVVEAGRVISLAATARFALAGERPASGLPDDQWVVVDAALSQGQWVVLDAASRVPDGAEARPLPPVTPYAAEEHQP